MPIEFPCAACAAQLRVPDTAAGRVVRCGRCQATFRAPVPASASAPEPTPPPPSALDPAPAAVSPPTDPATPAVTPAPAATLPPPESIPPVKPAPVPEDLPPPNDSPPSTTEAADTDPPNPPVKPARTRPSRSPRASREERAKSASSPLGKVLLAIGLLGVLLAAAAGYFVWREVNRPVEWETYESARGGYKVKMPAPPRNGMGARTNFRQTNPQMRVEGTLHRGNEYTVAWSDVRDERNFELTDEQLISATVNGLKEEFKDGRVEVGEPITVDGLPAREVTITIPGDAVFVVRIIVAGSRVYVVGAGGGGGPDSEANARRFIDSFAITDPEVKAGAKRMEEESRRRREEETRRQEELRRQAELARQAEIERAREEERKRNEEALAERKRLEAIAEAERKRLEEIAEAERKRLEAIAEAERKRRKDAEAEAEKFRAAQPELSAPDPTKLPGLSLYLSFDNVKDKGVPVWPEKTLPLPKKLSTGPGVRGSALYFSAEGGGLELDPELLPRAALTGPCTIGGWVKAKPLYGVDICHIATGENRIGTGVMRRKGKFVAYSRLNTPTVARPANEASNRQLSAPCPDDEKWHHVTLTRGEVAEAHRVNLYLDGELVATFPFSAGLPQIVNQWWLGLLKDDEVGLRPAPVPNNFPELPVAAADEICLFDRALSAHEVKYLAGKVNTPTPSAPVRVRLVEKDYIEPVAGVAFDLERNTVWAISEFNGYWLRSDEARPNQTKDASLLLRYSYPDFKLTGKWALPKRPQGEFCATAPILDLKNNRLYTALGYVGYSPTSLQREPDREGKFYRFDLNKLPEWEEDMPPPRLKEEASLPNALSRSAGDAAISPDGEWLYFTNRARGPQTGWGASVVRIPASLTESPKEISVPTHFRWGHWLWMSPDGKTVRVFQSGKPDPDGVKSAGLLEIRTDDWTAVSLKEVHGLDLSVREQARPVAFHPDGRVFIGGSGGVLETTYIDGGARRRLRPGPMRLGSSMAVSADGRFLFTADAQTGKNRLTVLDARANSTQIEELAILEESDKLRVGGRLFASPDGQFVVFRSGLVVRVDDGSVVERKKSPVAAVPSKPVEMAPMPRELPPRASPTDFKGLRLYIDFEKTQGNNAIDVVSKKPVGTLYKPESIPGPRGKAVRVTSEPTTPGGRSVGLVLKPELLDVEEEKPFTYALWARRFTTEPPNWSVRVLMALSGPREKTRTYFDIQFLATNDIRLYLDRGGVTTTRSTPQPDKDAWVHLVVRRNEQCEIQYFVDGSEVPQPNAFIFSGAWRSDVFQLGYALTGSREFDLDEFCLFDRALTDDEVAALAGRTKSPRPVNVAPMPHAAPKSPAAQVPPQPDNVAPMPHAAPLVSPADLRGLTFHLDCEEYDGQTVLDRVSKNLVGRAHHLQLVEDGPRGKALRITSGPADGTQKHPPGLSLPPELLKVDAGQPFTIAVWARFPGTKEAPGSGSLLIWDENRPDKTQYGIDIAYSRTGNVYFARSYKASLLVARSNPVVGVGAWSHVAITRDEADEIRFFLNGQQVPGPPGRTMLDGELNAAKFWFGWVNVKQCTVDIDDFCMFNRALTANEVGRLATPAPKAARPKSEVGLAPMPQTVARSRRLPPIPPAATDFKGLRLYIDFEEIEDDDAIDVVSKKPVGTLHKWELVDGPRGKAVCVVGETKLQDRRTYGLALKPGAMDVGAEKPFTLAMWVRRVPNDSTVPSFFAFRSQTTPKDQQKIPQFFNLFLEQNLNITFEMKDAQMSTKTSVTIAKTPEKYDWVHLVVRRNEKNELQYFFNGSESEQTKRVVFPGALRHDEYGLVSTSGGKRELFIDEFCLFDRALTDDEVTALAGRGKK